MSAFSGESSMSLFYWNRKSFSAEINRFLKVAARYRPEMISDNPAGVELKFKRITCNRIRTKYGKKEAVIEAKTIAGFGRGLGCLFAGLNVDESTDFKSIGIMIDCSRNKVFKLDYLKSYLFKMALMGGNLAMLYTEDTYQLPDEPFFGYMRGGYSMRELKELNTFAKALGIEIIGCIQTLGHLTNLLQHGAYDAVRDTSSVLLVDEPKTYQLIEKMLDFWSKALSSKRIHIGMDETHDLGRGRYMDIHGAQEKTVEIFNRHLKKVNDLCKKHGLKPIIWSDMYFRLGSKKHEYYDKDICIPDTVRAEIPKNVTLCYWDYYHNDQTFYEDYIQKHRALAGEPLVASGIWTWSNFWCDMEFTEATIIPCINACRKLKVKEIIFTMWGDDGAYCNYDSALMGIELACSLAYGEKTTRKKFLQKHFWAVTGENYELYRSSVIAKIYLLSRNSLHSIDSQAFILEDPLIGVWQDVKDSVKKGCLVDYLKSLKANEKRLIREQNLSLPLRIVLTLTELIIHRIEMRKALLISYQKSDHRTLREIALKRVPELVEEYGLLTDLIRQDWMNCAKPFGWEVIQRRLAATSARFGEVRTRILEYLNRRTLKIDELDEQLKIIQIIRNGDGIP